MGISRRQFLKAGAVFGGVILGAKALGIAGAVASERKGAAGGYFDNSLPPVLRIRSGDTVLVETGAHRMDGMVLGAQTEEWIQMYKKEMAGRPDAHFTRLAGPIHVEGAEPGDILQIEILEIIPAPYGFNIKPGPPSRKNGPGAGDFTNGRVEWYRTDHKENEFGFLPEARIPLRPFAGTLGVQRAGNLGCKEIIAGTVLYAPVHVKGAGVVTGNSFLTQGDGKADAGPSEGAFRNITLRLTVRKDPSSIPMGAADGG